MNSVVHANSIAKDIIEILVGDIFQSDCEAVVRSANQFLSREDEICGTIDDSAWNDFEKEYSEKYGNGETGKTFRGCIRLAQILHHSRKVFNSCFGVP